ncbi:hypothetical protein IW140_000683 [Coemansia sp. RSA 1813]|nr:Heat shock transcription factor [Coemansia sp. RSA 1646]KAJ2092432.1 hypothetical protein IW138_001194 [Coemansia sp. RSA 986]KAJ2217344.1 hypothetical protein EV179_000494 [Coemansia sp. RSA 487]KAJ2572568.1 hypothetical protein IW140_000683 [Coemansia sp. RSA 1813]
MANGSGFNFHRYTDISSSANTRTYACIGGGNKKRSRTEDAELSPSERWHRLPPSLRLIVNSEDYPVASTQSSQRCSRMCKSFCLVSQQSTTQVVSWRSERQPAVKAFPYALYRIIETPSNNEWIRWSSSGSFKFSSWPRLIQALSNIGFRATKKESVYKNLNNYRFERLSDSRRCIPDSDGVLWCQYMYQSFQQGRPDLLGEIKRQYAQ